MYDSSVLVIDYLIDSTTNLAAAIPYCSFPIPSYNSLTSLICFLERTLAHSLKLDLLVHKSPASYPCMLLHPRDSSFNTSLYSSLRPFLIASNPCEVRFFGKWPILPLGQMWCRLVEKQICWSSSTHLDSRHLGDQAECIYSLPTPRKETPSR